MSTFNITDKILRDSCYINQFIIPEVELMFLGIRGAITSLPNNQSFKENQPLNLMDVNYRNPRCTIFQWNLRAKTLAAFPASTVPNLGSINMALSKNGVGANSLLTGFYKDYRKGWHKAGQATGHEAFRQNGIHPIRRTIDDLDYDKDDRIEYDNPQDNIHCGWFQSLDATNYSSAGCQVIMGYPKCNKPGREKSIGPWAIFHDYAYKLKQDVFPYILLDGVELLTLTSDHEPMSFKLRFGSKGLLVEKLQKKLKGKDYYEGKIDGDFGERTMKALIGFQKNVFGIDGADGILGPVTAQELGLDISFVGIGLPA